MMFFKCIVNPGTTFVCENFHIVRALHTPFRPPQVSILLSTVRFLQKIYRLSFISEPVENLSSLPVITQSPDINRGDT